MALVERRTSYLKAQILQDLPQRTRAAAERVAQLHPQDAIFQVPQATVAVDAHQDRHRAVSLSDLDLAAGRLADLVHELGQSSFGLGKADRDLDRPALRALAFTDGDLAVFDRGHWRPPLTIMVYLTIMVKSWRRPSSSPTSSASPRWLSCRGPPRPSTPWATWPGSWPATFWP